MAVKNSIKKQSDPIEYVQLCIYVYVGCVCMTKTRIIT